jgi:hypothetical protein
MVGLPNCGSPDNAVTQCIKKEAMVWGAITRNPLFSVLKLPSRYRLLDVPPFDAQPVDSTRLNVQGSIGPLGSLAAGAYTPVVSYLVPSGYDGVINSTFNKFVPSTGPGLQDGSGMIQWVIQINNYLQFNYTDITMQMGETSTLGPMPYGGGIRIKTNDFIQMFALVNTAGLAFLDPAGLIIGALQGWVYAGR